MADGLPISRTTHAAAPAPAPSTKPAAAPAAKPAASDRLHLTPLKTNLQRAWETVNPWAHASVNTRQIDGNIIAGSSPFTKQAKAAFAKVDTNHDGTVSALELDKAAQMPSLSKQEAAAITTMRQHVKDIEDLSQDEHFLETKGITRDDLDQVDRLKGNSVLAQAIHETFEGGGLETVKRPVNGPIPPSAARPVAVTPLRSTAAPTAPAAVVPPKPSAAPRKSLLKRIDLTDLKAGAKEFWGKYNPWVHEKRNVSQIDPAAKAKATDFTTHARAVFDRVDADRNGTLSNRELNTAMASPAYRQADAAAVGALHKYADDIEDLSNDERSLETKGITRKDLDQFDKLKSDSDLSGNVQGNYSYGVFQINRTDRRLYANDKAVRGTVIEQGHLGDCYFLAGVAALADKDPEAIKRMIHDNKDGTYNVAFPGRKPVTVTAPTDAELSQYASAGRNGIWLNVLEKAYAKSRNDGRLFAKGDMYKAIEGGFGSQSIKALTGKDASASQIRFLSKSQMLAKVSQAQADGRLMTISTGHPIGRDRTKANNLPTSHEYTMLGYDANAGKYRIRNPWGTGGAKNDGMLELTADEVKKNFTRITVQKR